jgi:uncharacterized protein
VAESEIVLVGLTLAVMFVGLAGVVVPVVPDVWLIWLAALGYGLLAGFDGWVGGLAMLALTALTLLGVAIDLALGPVAARRGGASWQAIAASLLLGLVGLFVLPPLGPLVGAMLGLFAVEYHQRGRNARQAWAAVKGYAMGCGSSAVLRALIALSMIGIYVAWVFIASRA